MQDLKHRSSWELSEMLMDALGEHGRASKEKDRRTVWLSQDKILDIREELIQRFADAHGWKHSETWFSDRVLAERKVHSGNRTDLYKSLNGNQGSHYIDHAYFFRDHKKRAAGLVVHLYDVPSDIRTVALKAGLRVSFPDFPSWWNPGFTTLALYTPLMEARP